MAANPHVSQFNRVLSTTDNETGMAKDSLAHTIPTSALCFVLDLALSRTTVVPRLRVGPHIFLSRFELKGYVYDESHGLHHMPGIPLMNGDTAFQNRTHGVWQDACAFSQHSPLCFLGLVSRPVLCLRHSIWLGCVLSLHRYNCSFDGRTSCRSRIIPAARITCSRPRPRHRLDLCSITARQASV